MSNMPFNGGPPGPGLGAAAAPAMVQSELELAIERAEVAQQAAGALLYEYRPHNELLHPLPRKGRSFTGALTRPYTGQFLINI